MFFAERISLAITVAAITISRRLSSEETALIGAALSQFGDALATIAAAKDLAAAAQQKTEDQKPEATTEDSGNNAAETQ